MLTHKYKSTAGALAFKAEVDSCKRKEMRYQMFPEETKTHDSKGNLRKEKPKGQVNAGFHWQSLLLI